MLKDMTQEELNGYFTVDMCDLSSKLISKDQARLFLRVLENSGYLKATEYQALQALCSGISPAGISYSLFANFFQMGREFERKRIEIEQLQQLIREKREEIG